LEEEREKAKKIREKMSGITGGMNYGGSNSSGGYNSDSKFESYNNTNYTSSKQASNYGHFNDY
jgi:hypothetical protein